MVKACPTPGPGNHGREVSSVPKTCLLQKAIDMASHSRCPSTCLLGPHWNLSLSPSSAPSGVAPWPPCVSTPSGRDRLGRLPASDHRSTFAHRPLSEGSLPPASCLLRTESYDARVLNSGRSCHVPLHGAVPQRGFLQVTPGAVPSAPLWGGPDIFSPWFDAALFTNSCRSRIRRPFQTDDARFQMASPRPWL